MTRNLPAQKPRRAFRRCGRIAALACALFAAPLSCPAAAQERPRPSIEFAAGWVGFADDGVVNESLIGGAARWYLLPRVSVGPEVLSIHGLNHSHLIATGNVTLDVLSPANGRPPRLNPFFVVGGGLFQTSEQFFVGTFTSREGAFTAGGGIRAFAGDRVAVGAEARVGWELHIRINALVEVQLGR
jgi:hypothetical protein